MNTSRRTVLALLSTATSITAGCSSGIGSDYFSRRPSIKIETQPLPEELDAMFEFDAEVVEGFSRGHPGRIRLQLVYEGTENNHMDLQFGPTPPFSMYIGGKQQEDAGPPTIFAIPSTTDTITAASGMREPDQWIPDDMNDGCWQQRTMPEPYPESADDPVMKQLEPGDEIAEEYSILGFGREDDCLPSGKYWFETGEPYEVDGEESEWTGERGGLAFTINLD